MNNKWEGPNDYTLRVYRDDNGKYVAASSRGTMLLSMVRCDTQAEAVDLLMFNTIFASDMQQRKCREILSL